MARVHRAGEQPSRALLGGHAGERACKLVRGVSRPRREAGALVAVERVLEVSDRFSGASERAGQHTEEVGYGAVAMQAQVRA